MGGGLMQLVAYGAQDIYLTGNPQITFFKVVYRRHTNFSMEAIQQTFDGTADFGNTVSCTISRNGDLVHRMYLEHDAVFRTLPGENNGHIGVIANYGSNLMKEMEIEIGGQMIDRHYSHWHSVYSQLTEFNPSGYETTLYNYMSGNGIGRQTATGEVTPAPVWEQGTVSGSDGDTLTGHFYIPLYFWFCRNPGLALPLIALQYHEVKVKIILEEVSQLGMGEEQSHFSQSNQNEVFTTQNVSSSSFKLWCDYIYLDTDERRRFAQVSHEYLIEQVQHNLISEANDFNKKIIFNHPVKEIIWCNVNHPIIDHAVSTSGDSFRLPIDDIRYLTAPFSLEGDFKLIFNGHDRFEKRNYRYFTRTQVWQHHTGYGGYIGQTASGDTPQLAKSEDTIAVYSFALKPEEHQPSGTCNFSRIDTAYLERSNSTTNLTGGLNVYAVNYNVLRIMSGMGGLAYSN